MMNILNKMTTLPHRLYDVIIAGGGLIGSTMACSLGKNPAFEGLQIALIEAAPKRTYHLSDTYSNRVSSLNPNTKNLLTDLGIWKNIRRFREVKNMKVWGSYSYDCTNFFGTNEEVLAYIVENNELINAITQELNTINNVDVLYDAKVKTIILNNHSSPVLPQIYLENDQNYTCKLLIGADGPSSKIRKAMGVKQIGWNYNQSGVVATLRIRHNSQNYTAWQKFLPEGPIALLPLDDDYSSLVWSTTPEKAKTLLQMPCDAFIDAINIELAMAPIKNDTLKSLKNVMNMMLPVLKNQVELEYPEVYDVVESSRAAFPLAFAHTSEYVIPSAVLIGDSAHRVHPLAGQGVNLGFRDVQILTKALSSGILEGRVFGDIKDLRVYEGLSQKSNFPVMAAIDFIHRVYTSNREMVQVFGSLGFKVADNPLVKHLMKSFASH